MKQCNIPQGSFQELQICLPLPFLTLVAIHSDRYMLTVTQIIDLFICLEACCHVTSTMQIVIDFEQ